MAKKKEAQKRMPPAEYREFLQQVELQSIVLDSCSVKTNRDNIASNMKLDVRSKAGYAIDDKKIAVVNVQYDLKAYKSAKKDFALKLSCVYRVMLASELPITEDFMEIFLKVNIQTNTWPYFREFVQGMLQRIEYPPLTLPFSKQ